MRDAGPAPWQEIRERRFADPVWVHHWKRSIGANRQYRKTMRDRHIAAKEAFKMQTRLAEMMTPRAKVKLLSTWKRFTEWLFRMYCRLFIKQTEERIAATRSSV